MATHSSILAFPPTPKKGCTVKRLTPLRLFLAKICEDVVGDMEPKAELKFLNEQGEKETGIAVKRE